MGMTNPGWAGRPHPFQVHASTHLDDAVVDLDRLECEVTRARWRQENDPRFDELDELLELADVLGDEHRRLMEEHEQVAVLTADSARVALPPRLAVEFAARERENEDAMLRVRRRIHQVLNSS
ncbi:MAG: hypothetical protein ACRCTR_07795 [Actinomycetota bacterium]